MKQQQQRKSYTLAELTQHFSQDLGIQIIGDPSCVIKGVCTIQNAKPQCITFLMNSVYKKYLPKTKASAVILLAGDVVMCQTNAIVTRDPYYTYAKIAEFFVTQSPSESGIHPSAVIGKNCDIADSVSIAAHCVIGNRVQIAADVAIAAGCVIGDDCIIGEKTCLDANVSVYSKTVIGKNVSISSGVVVGSDGFGNVKYKGQWHKVPQLGRVVIEDDVEIGANCTIDRGAIEDTVLSRGVRLDNLIQVGHNVTIGENTAIAGCVGISGSVVIGKNCLIGGGTAIAGHITVADNVMITGRTDVTKSIREPGIYSSGVGGLVTNIEWRKTSARVHRLDQLTQRVKDLESALRKREK